MAAQSIKLKMGMGPTMTGKWKHILAAGVAAALGLVCGLLLWSRLAPELMPDLSEQPSVASSYLARTGR
jgi:hypothetical protein